MFCVNTFLKRTEMLDFLHFRPNTDYLRNRSLAAPVLPDSSDNQKLLYVLFWSGVRENLQVLTLSFVSNTTDLFHFMWFLSVRLHTFSSLWARASLPCWMRCLSHWERAATMAMCAGIFSISGPRINSTSQNIRDSRNLLKSSWRVHFGYEENWKN